MGKTPKVDQNSWRVNRFPANLNVGLADKNSFSCSQQLDDSAPFIQTITKPQKIEVINKAISVNKTRRKLE